MWKHSDPMCAAGEIIVTLSGSVDKCGGINMLGSVGYQCSVCGAKIKRLRKECFWEEPGNVEA